MDLPLVGDHKAGVAEKQSPETLVNLYIEDEGANAYLRSRPGYERFDRYNASPSGPTDPFQDIDNLTGLFGVGTADGSTSNIRYGYQIGDIVTISAATNSNWNKSWTITAVSADGGTFSFNFAENGGNLADELSTPARVQATSAVYKKEIRLLQRYDNGATLDIRAVMGNRVYEWTFASGWAELTNPQNRFISMNGAVSGEIMGDQLADGVVLCDGVSAVGENVTPQTLVYTPAETGTDDTSTAAAFLTDSTATWVVDQFVGETITNVTDSSTGTITANTATTVTATMSSGTWDSGDSYSIPAMWSSRALAVKSNTATFIDGYIIRDDKDNTGRFIYSDLYKASVENPFNFATAEGAPDDLVAVIADRRELWLFGEYSTEVWYNSGDKNLPFQRFQGGFSETGCAAPLTVKKFDNSLMWLAQDKRGGPTVVRAGDGFQPVMVSTPQINTLLLGRSEYLFNAHANVIRIVGHEFYILTIPGYHGVTTVPFTPNTPLITLVYDAQTKVWSQWKSADALLNANDVGRFFLTSSIQMYDSDNRSLATDSTYGRGFIIGGRDGSGEFYNLIRAVDEHPDGTQGIEWERTLPAIVAPSRKRFGLGAVELETDEDAAAGGTYSLSYAKDGKTFTTPADRTVTTSQARLMWKKVGRAYRWILRFSGTTAFNLPAELIKAVSTEPGDD